MMAQFIDNFAAYNGCFFKSGVEVGVELSIVNALYRLRITDQLFKSYALHEWCDLNRLSNAYFDAKFKKTPFTWVGNTHWNTKS
jgi:hypothetical protein